uniref:Uncharacterized protein n=1 Tax=Anguilla anguilla TaxID=7936 RepID=A0A0E9SD96_ANGAN
MCASGPAADPAPYLDEEAQCLRAKWIELNAVPGGQLSRKECSHFHVLMWNSVVFS